MPLKRSIQLRCPICKKPVENCATDFPFCSERCRLLDLGNWASGAYVVPSPVTDAEEEIRTNQTEDPDEP
jgi:uncharacterized protein